MSSTEHPETAEAVVEFDVHPDAADIHSVTIQAVGAYVNLKMTAGAPVDVTNAITGVVLATAEFIASIPSDEARADVMEWVLVTLPAAVEGAVEFMGSVKAIPAKKAGH
jgi:hypothetical protein